MYYIGLDVHKKTISYCVKDASGQGLLKPATEPTKVLLVPSMLDWPACEPEKVLLFP